PIKAMTISTAVMVSGILAIAVSRCRMKSSVPDFAEPWPRTRPSGVRMFEGGGLMAWISSPQSSHQVSADHPQNDRQQDRSDQMGARQPLPLGRAEAPAGIPYKVPHPAKHVMDQGPGVAEQNNPADEARSRRLKRCVGGRT